MSFHLSPASEANMKIFTNNPDKYILRASQKNNEVSLGVMKKGFFTWIIVHIGGLLGCFNAKSVKMQRIVSLLDQLDSELDAKFKESLDSKIRKFQVYHFPLFRSQTESYLNNLGFFKEKDLISPKRRIQENILNLKLDKIIPIYAVTMKQIREPASEKEIKMYEFSLQLKPVKTKTNPEIKEIAQDNFIDPLFARVIPISHLYEKLQESAEITLGKILRAGYREVKVRIKPGFERSHLEDKSFITVTSLPVY